MLCSASAGEGLASGPQAGSRQPEFLHLGDSLGILRYATEFREAVLLGSSSARMCVALAAPLAAAFGVLGLRAQLHESDLGHCNHVFIRLEDGRVLDPTADQFNDNSAEALPGVYLGHEARIHQAARAWGGGREWIALMAQLQRLYPDFGAAEVARTVRLVLTTLPKGVCDFEREARA